MRTIALLALFTLLATPALAAKPTRTAQPYARAFPVKLSAGLGLTDVLSQARACPVRSENAVTFIAARAATPLVDHTTLELELARTLATDWHVSYRAGIWYTF